MVETSTGLVSVANSARDRGVLLFLAVFLNGIARAFLPPGELQMNLKLEEICSGKVVEDTHTHRSG
jgi:hypothetical protein